jgi:uncharacterized protein YkwD
MTALNRILQALLGVALAVTLAMGATTPAVAAPSYRVSIAKVSDKTPRVGDVVRLTGKLTGRTTKASAALQRRWKGHSSWATVSSIAISSAGTFTATDKISANKDRYYRVFKASEAGRKSAHSNSVFVNVSAKVGTITMTAVANKDSSVTVSGKLNSVGGKVTVRNRTSGTSTWSSYNLGVGSDGSYSATVRFPVGLRDIQLYRAATSDVTSVTSKTITIKVHDGVTVVSEKAISFATQNVPDGNRLVCYPPLVTTEGVNGVLTTYADGTTSRIDPVTQVQRVGTKACSSTAPTLTTISPDSGRLTGGGVTTLTGTGLASVTAVTFTPIVKASWTISGDGVMPVIPATFDTNSDSSLQVTVPQGLGGATTITVASALGEATTTYTYVATWRDPTQQEQGFLDAVNRWRAVGYPCRGDGVVYKGPTLTWNGQWADVMESHSIDMVRRYPAYILLQSGNPGGWLHQAPNILPGYRLGLSGLSRGGGEVAQGAFGSGSGVLTPTPIEAQEAADAFIHSEGHCVILLNLNMRQLGAGQAYGMGDAKTMVAYWTALAG